ncbi:DUF1501 domain-containing protein [Anatilimnocola aggregata]|uniref:DUF1501 domain-containing protein n=1 Tax=Anatilimnocola aggregata TaxID=2528021 RepID=UPI00192E344E|nr:DUF1501 domain-containing protein [Anatilimnocola aggregata]
MNVRTSRRAALQIGAGLFGLNLPQWLQAAPHAGRKSSDISCIFLFLAGGPSQYETFDPKPDAPVEIRGLWQPISTNVAGTHICEKLPLMAQRMDKVTIIRSWQGRNGGHDVGSQHVASGFLPARNEQYFPNFGCLVSALRGNRVPGIPAHLGLPVAARYTNPPGYLGAAYDAFNIKGDPSAPTLQFNKLSVDASRFENRRSLLAQMENLNKLSVQNAGPFEAHDKFGAEAISLLTSGAMARAMNLDEERTSLRERYGQNIYGQRVLMGRRLIEAGARFVTINQAVQGGLFGDGTTDGTWDNHQLLFESMMSVSEAPANAPSGYKWHSYRGPGNLPQLDMSLSALLDDLEERGLLDTTLVVVMGEFGRTPRINKDGGRDHYPNAGCVLMAGAGISRGAVIGATDRSGAFPATRPWTPEDVAASIYHALGIEPHRTYFPRLPRPTPIAAGQVIDGLFA